MDWRLWLPWHKHDLRYMRQAILLCELGSGETRVRSLASPSSVNTGVVRAVKNLYV